MSKIDEYKKSKRKASSVRTEKAEGGTGFVTHTEYEDGDKDEGYKKPEMHVHKSLSSVASHMKDCLS